MKKSLSLLTLAALITIPAVQAGDTCCSTAKETTSSKGQKGAAKEYTAISTAGSGKAVKTLKKAQATAKGGYRG